MIRKEYRTHLNDPMYVSTDNWKTLEQWCQCGFVLKPTNQLKVIKVNWIIWGYSSAFCTCRVVRLHRLAMRKKYVRKVCK